MNLVATTGAVVGQSRAQTTLPPNYNIELTEFIAAELFEGAADERLVEMGGAIGRLVLVDP